MAVANLVVRLRAQGAEATRAAVRGVKEETRELGETARRVGGHVAGLGGRLKDIAGQALSGARTLALLTGVASTMLSVFAFNTAAKTDSLIRGLAAVERNAFSLTRRLSELREVAKLPGLGFGEAIQADVQLRAAGLSADLSKRALVGFGNALASVGRGKADLDGVILALGQISSKGKVSAEEINQLNERVPQIRQAIIRAFGTADTEALDKLGITAEVFLPKIIAEMEKLPRVTGGAMNAIENLSDGIQKAVTPLGQGFIEMLSAATPATERLLNIIEARANKIGGVLAAIGRSGVLNEVLQSLVTGFDKLTGAGTQNGIARIAGILLAAVKQIPAAFELAFNISKAIVQNILIGAKYIFDIARKTISALTLGVVGGQSQQQSSGQSSVNAGLGFPVELLKAVPWGKLLQSPLAKKALPIAGALGLTPGLIEAISGAIASTPAPNFVPLPSGTGLKNDFLSDAARFTALIQQSLRPLSQIPDGLTFGGQGGALSKTGSAVRDRIDDLLSKIEQNTKASADRLSLREQTTGGGDLARLGVTPQELFSRGAGTGYRPMYADAGAVGSNLERELTKLIIRVLQQQGAGIAGL